MGRESRWSSHLQNVRDIMAKVLRKGQNAEKHKHKETNAEKTTLRSVINMCVTACCYLIKNNQPMNVAKHSAILKWLVKTQQVNGPSVAQQ